MSAKTPVPFPQMHMLLHRCTLRLCPLREFCYLSHCILLEPLLPRNRWVVRQYPMAPLIHALLLQLSLA